MDALGNTLDVEGNHIESQVDIGSPKKIFRPVNGKLGEVDETIWLSLLIDGTSADAIHNVSLGDGLFMGQGGKDTGSTTWQLGDQDGLVDDAGLASDGLAFLVLRVDFTAGDELAWLWADPLLDVTPGVASAHAMGTVKSFEADFIQTLLEVPATAGLDEIRLGRSFADVAPYTRATSVPEPGTVELLGLGLAGLSLGARRRSRARR